MKYQALLEFVTIGMCILYKLFQPSLGGIFSSQISYNMVKWILDQIRKWILSL